LIARVHRIDLLSKLEIVGECRINQLCAGGGIDIGAGIRELIVVLLKGIAKSKRARLRYRQRIVGAKLGCRVIFLMDWASLNAYSAESPTVGTSRRILSLIELRLSVGSPVVGSGAITSDWISRCR
jgi:hypothetical protein